MTREQIRNAVRSGKNFIIGDWEIMIRRGNYPCIVCINDEFYWNCGPGDYAAAKAEVEQQLDRAGVGGLYSGFPI